MFDFGGVIAAEGFREGLQALACQQGRDPEQVYQAGCRIMATCGYLIGQAPEADFWQGLSREAGIDGSAKELRQVILDRFIVRPGMLALADALRAAGIRVAILSDQTDWLELLDQRARFSAHFERVDNSFHLGISKHVPEAFVRAAERLGVVPARIVFVDDNAGNIDRAARCGMQALLFHDEATLRHQLSALC